MTKLNLAEKRNTDILETHQYVNARSARSNFSRLVNTARIDMERVIITEHGEPAAAIVPIKDVRLLENLPIWVNKISDAQFKELDLSQIKNLLNGFIVPKAYNKEDIDEHFTKQTRSG